MHDLYNFVISEKNNIQVIQMLLFVMLSDMLRGLIRSFKFSSRLYCSSRYHVLMEDILTGALKKILSL